MMAKALNEVTPSPNPTVAAQMFAMVDHVIVLEDLYEAFSVAQRVSDGFEASRLLPLPPQ